MNFMLALTPEQWRLVQATAERTGRDPADLVFRALELGWECLQRELDGVPPPPRGLTLVR